MYNKLYIIGAGGHGKVVADIALKCGYKDISFIDDNAVGSCLGFDIMGSLEIAESLCNENTDFVIAIGDNKIRKEISEVYNLNWVTLIHPSAQIGCGVDIGTGSVVMAGAVINPETKIGEHCIINSNSTVEHDNILGDFVHISPGASLGGTVKIGNKTHIGIGATIKNNINICENVLIGAGAVIVKDILQDGVYIGVPAFKSNGSIRR